MIYELQYWSKTDDLPEATSIKFNNLGQLMSYFRPHFPAELTDNHWTLLINLDVWEDGELIDNKGSFTVAHSQMSRQEIDDLMAVNPAYQVVGISAIRQAFLKEYDKI